MLDFLRTVPAVPVAQSLAGTEETAQPRRVPAVPPVPVENERTEGETRQEGDEEPQEVEPKKRRARLANTTGTAGTSGTPHNQALKPVPAAVARTGTTGTTNPERWPPGEPLTLRDWLRTPLVTCGSCRHHEPDPLNPPLGIGDCIHDNGRGPSLRPQVPRCCAQLWRRRVD